MIETVLKEYVIDEILAALPSLSGKQLLVSFPEASFDYGKNIRRDGIRKIIGQETLSCLALILSAGRVNRHPVIARFKEARVTVGQYRILQRFTGCRMSEFVEAAQRFETLFQINFIVDVYEEENL